MSSNFSLKSIGSAFFLQMVVVLRVLRHSFGWGSFWDLNFKRNEVSWPLNLMTLKRRRGKRLECHTNSQMIFPQKEPEKRKDIKDRHVLGFFKLLFFAHRSLSALPPISRLTLEKKFLLPLILLPFLFCSLKQSIKTRSHFHKIVSPIFLTKKIFSIYTKLLAAYV